MENNNPFSKNSKPYLFVELAKPDKNGQSRKVFVNEFTYEFETLKFGNGGDWCRSDGSLAKKYILERFKEKNSIVAIQLFGFNTKNQISKQIRTDIVKQINAEKCAILQVSKVEVDHKDGRRDDYQNFKKENQTTEQFQALSKAANTAKRQHCKTCRDTDERFDAKLLGYAQSTWTGDTKYRGTCVGCYWHDIKKFNEEISKHFTFAFNK
jgi:hypothetical protein